MWIHIYFATHKFHGFSEKLSLAESTRGGITVVIRSNMLCSVLSQPKHQLSIEQAVSAHFQAVTPSIPPSAQKHNRRKRPAGSSREEERKKITISFCTVHFLRPFGYRRPGNRRTELRWKGIFPITLLLQQLFKLGFTATLTQNYSAFLLSESASAYVSDTSTTSQLFLRHLQKQRSVFNTFSQSAVITTLGSFRALKSCLVALFFSCL